MNILCKNGGIDLKKLIIIAFIALIILMAYIWYPKSGTFNGFVLSKLSNLNLSGMDIYNGDTLQSGKKVSTEKDVADFLSTLKDVQLTQYNKTNIRPGNTLYTIDIYDKNHNGFEITVYDSDIISIFISGKSSINYYKVKNKTLNINYVDNYFNKS